MEFMNGSGRDIDTLFPDNFHFFELLAMLVNEEPRDLFGPLERFQLQVIGIEKDKPFHPDEETKALMAEAVKWAKVTQKKSKKRQQTPLRKLLIECAPPPAEWLPERLCGFSKSNEIPGLGGARTHNQRF